jgi:cysteine desulfurase
LKKSYFDHNATTPISSNHWQEVWQELGASAANASSPHSFGRDAHVALTKARSRVAAALGFDVSEIIFTSGGSESNTAATLGILESKCFENPNQEMHVVCSTIEHPCVIESLRYSQKAFGVTVTFVGPQSNGLFSMESFLAALQPKTVLVSLMAANNETGLRLPVKEFADWLHKKRWDKNYLADDTGPGITQATLRDLHFHTDCVQIFGKVPLEKWMSLGADSVAICAHKLGGFAGIGALALRRGRRLVPRVMGGPQEKSRRSGTENLPGVVSLGIIAEQTLSSSWKEGWQRVEMLKGSLRAKLTGCTDLKEIVDPAAPCLPNTLSYFLPREVADTVDLVMELDIQGICLSTGSACSSGVNKASPFLLALGHNERDAKNTLRISLGLSNTAQEVDDLSSEIALFLARQ